MFWGGGLEGRRRLDPEGIEVLAVGLGGLVWGLKKEDELNRGGFGREDDWFTGAVWGLIIWGSVLGFDKGLEVDWEGWGLKENPLGSIHVGSTQLLRYGWYQAYGGPLLISRLRCYQDIV